MMMTSMRVFPGLFVGCREVVMAAPRDQAAGEPSRAFLCGACEEVVLTDRDRADLAHLVVKCRCGEYNQL